MNFNKIIFSWQRQVVIGLIVGLTISIIDHYALKDEVSPIIKVLMLLTASGFSGLLFGWPGWFTVLIVWVFVPATHFIKYILGLSQAHHHLTITAILEIVVFSFAAAAVGFVAGVLVRRFINNNSAQSNL